MTTSLQEDKRAECEGCVYRDKNDWCWVKCDATPPNSEVCEYFERHPLTALRKDSHRLMHLLGEPYETGRMTEPCKAIHIVHRMLYLINSLPSNVKLASTKRSRTPP